MSLKSQHLEITTSPNRLAHPHQIVARNRNLSSLDDEPTILRLFMQNTLAPRIVVSS